jgi:hypothetical protein
MVDLFIKHVREAFDLSEDHPDLQVKGTFRPLFFAHLLEGLTDKEQELLGQGVEDTADESKVPVDVYQFWRSFFHKIIKRADVQWNLIDTTTGKPVALTDENLDFVHDDLTFNLGKRIFDKSQELLGNSPESLSSSSQARTSKPAETVSESTSENLAACQTAECASTLTTSQNQ